MRPPNILPDLRQDLDAAARVHGRKETGAWITSLLAHVGLLVLLATVTVYVPKRHLALTATTVDTELDEAPRQVQLSPETTLQVGARGLAGHQAATSLAPIVADIDQIPPTEVMDLDEPSIALQEEIDIATATNLSERLLVKGDIGVGVTSAMGAIDRITQEILVSLEQRPTLVVWMFDQSGSLDATRAAIYERFDRIYEELGILEGEKDRRFSKHGEAALLTAVMAFGREVTFRTKKPTDDLEEVKEAIAGIENDPNGIEMVFTAVEKAAKRYRSYRTAKPLRNVMLVVISDEVGNDEQRIENALALCRRFAMPVYVVGVPAPFGRRQSMVKYIDPDPRYDQSVTMIGVDQGPESAVPERLMLSFSTPRQQETLEQIDSGFGPFFLTRLCYETGGIYFAVHPNKDQTQQPVGRSETPVLAAVLHHFFDAETMRRYRPNYASADEYRRMLNSKKATAALVAAAQMSRVEPMKSPRLRFPKRDDAQLKGLLDRAQQAAAKLEPKLDALYQVLEVDEEDRAKLRLPRWEAGYDLAMGRLLAMKVRTQGYNAMLAALKQGKPFKKPQSDTWILKPADTIKVDSRLERIAEEAKTFLKRVCDEHPGTPWALLADAELKTPMGWQWSEMHTGITRPGAPPTAGNNNLMPRDDRLRKLEKPKPRRPNIRL